MRVRLTRDFTFEAAHLLPKAPEGHKCRRLHGHSFRVEVCVEGEVDPTTGWLLDYGEIKRLIEPLRVQLDHYYLNEVNGLENATSENLARWIWERLRPSLPSLAKITVHETCEARCEYEGK
ncbi:MAG TPA: 6-carboxytetrahydropterin synthase QueD [Candidatus Dormibacteraeota bacterium]|nr:6-carboxytetrahydropterin synthase QueD [Candidatus Dormibacteraeota bacterium]